MGVGASTSSVSRMMRRRRLAFYRALAQSDKTSACFGMKASATRAMVQIALEIDTECETALTALSEGLRREEATKNAELAGIIRKGQAQLMSMRGNRDAMRNAAQNPTFLAFMERYRAKKAECDRVHAKVVQRRRELAVVTERLGNWQEVLSLHELDDSDYNATELINITAGYVEMRELTAPVGDSGAATERLAGALSASNPFDIDAPANDTNEIANMLKILFATGEAAPAYTEGAAVMVSAPAADDDFITFRSPSAQVQTKTSRSQFAADTAVWG
jgi:hypothetical protein